MSGITPPDTTRPSDSTQPHPWAHGVIESPASIQRIQSIGIRAFAKEKLTELSDSEIDEISSRISTYQPEKQQCCIEFFQRATKVGYYEALREGQEFGIDLEFITTDHFSDLTLGAPSSHLEYNIDAWVSTQANQRDALEVKRRILDAYQNNPFNLDISRLNITSLPSCLSSLSITTLNCSECTHLSELPALPNCTTLNCNNCLRLRELPALPNCISLKCNTTAFEELPPLPNCRTLECCNSMILRLSPALPNCTNLQCFNCQNLTELPDLPNCIELNCSDCRQLRQIPDLPNCTTLGCSNCRQLLQIGNLQNCITLECDNCRRLSQLPDLLNCTTLNCCECHELRQLPALPNCRQLGCLACPLLTDLSQMPENAEVYSSIDFQTCRIRWRDLNENPHTVLMALLPYLKAGRFPNIVFLDDSGEPQQGIDAGGLRRHLMSQLFAQLSKLNLIPGTKDSNSKLRPTIGASNETYEAIGLLFAKACHNNLPIGQVFSPEFFADIREFSTTNIAEYETNPQELVGRLCRVKYPDISLKLNAFTNIEEFNNSEIVQYSGIEIPEGLDLERAKEYFLNESMQDIVTATTPFYQAAFLIAKTMQEKMGTDWDELCALAPDVIQGRIEGSFSKESFVSSIRWEGQAHDVTRHYLLTWIEEQPEERVKQLLQFTTGSLSLSGNPTLVDLSNPDEGSFPLPTSHSCARQLCIPTNYTNQEMFNQKLADALEESAQSGFTFL